ncbi:hypothetical protein SAMN05720354_11327 [Nitrosospira sp. Nsp1]|nr:hypothetical protein SAMN05720354_11327 [Nitrosospira sp. Nsp1]
MPCCATTEWRLREKYAGKARPRVSIQQSFSSREIGCGRTSLKELAEGPSISGYRYPLNDSCRFERPTGFAIHFDQPIILATTSLQR